MSHANAPLSETGRLRLARCVVDQGWSLRRAAERFAVSARTARRWADRSSRPASSPRRTPTRIERRVIGLRVVRRWGPARIAFHLRHQGLAPSTVHKILRRHGCPPLAWTDPATGTRLAYSELLTDERKETAAGFWMRAQAHFAAAGITVRRALTHNGSCYRSHTFATALGEDIAHKRTRPYRPQANGKVERFNRTMLEEWAYAQPYTSEAERVAAFADWLNTYNHHRGHTALAGKSPADLVPNLSGQHN